MYVTRNTLAEKVANGGENENLDETNSLNVLSTGLYEY